MAAPSPDTFAWMLTWHGCPMGFESWREKTLGKAIENWVFDERWKLPRVLLGSSSIATDEEDVLVAYPLLASCVPELVDFHVEKSGSRWEEGRKLGWLSKTLSCNFFLPNAPAKLPRQLQVGEALLVYWSSTGGDGIDVDPKQDFQKHHGLVSFTKGAAMEGSCAWSVNTSVWVLFFESLEMAQTWHQRNLMERNEVLGYKIFEVQQDSFAPS